jgi:hypothetical protein
MKSAQGVLTPASLLPAWAGITPKPCCGLDPRSSTSSRLVALISPLRKRAVKKGGGFAACPFCRLLGFAWMQRGSLAAPALVLSPALRPPVGQQTSGRGPLSGSRRRTPDGGFELVRVHLCGHPEGGRK